MSSFLFSSVSATTVRAALAACIVMASMNVFPSTAARAEDAASRLNRLEREIETLNRAVYKGEQPPASSSLSSSGGSAEYQAGVETRLTDIETQIRDLTGKVEQQSFETNQLKDRLDRALSDIELRLSSAASSPTANPSAVAGSSSLSASSFPSEGAGAESANQTGTLKAGDMGGVVSSDETAAASPAASQAVTDYDAPAPSDSPTQQNLGTLTESPGGASIPPQAGNDPAGQYEMAFSLMKSENYAASRNGFETFLKQYPDHPLSGNAMYWLGENYYAESQFEKAVRVFAEGYKKYPKGPKAPDSLLKMGMSLGKLGKTEQACVTLSQLKKEYKTGQDALVKRAGEEGAKLGCGN